MQRVCCAGRLKPSVDRRPALDRSRQEGKNGAESENENRRRKQEIWKLLPSVIAPKTNVPEQNLSRSRRDKRWESKPVVMLDERVDHRQPSVTPRPERSWEAVERVAIGEIENGGSDGDEDS